MGDGEAKAVEGAAVLCVTRLKKKGNVDVKRERRCVLT